MLIFHNMILAKKAPEFELSEDEALQESKAIVNYLRHSKVAISPKTHDLFALIAVLTVVEGSRLMAFTMRQKQERAERARAKATTEGQNVFPMGVAG